MFVGYNHVTSFETLSHKGTTLSVERCATTGSKRGEGLGESCLHAFTRQLKLKNTSINSIQFDLARVTDNPSQSDVQALADAREHLPLENMRVEYRQVRAEQQSHRRSRGLEQDMLGGAPSYEIADPVESHEWSIGW